MTDITELEQRLSVALARMRAAFAAAGRRAEAAEAERDRLTEAKAELESERDLLSAELATRSMQSGGEAEDTLPPEELSAEISQLAEALEAEQANGAALNEQIAALKARDSAELARLRGDLEEMQARLSEAETGMSQLRRVNAQLRQNNQALRQAHEAALPDAGLVNEGLQAELAALQATRAADRAELDSILAALKPLIEENAHA